MKDFFNWVGRHPTPIPTVMLALFLCTVVSVWVILVTAAFSNGQSWIGISMFCLPGVISGIAVVLLYAKERKNQ